MLQRVDSVVTTPVQGEWRQDGRGLVLALAISFLLFWCFGVLLLQLPSLQQKASMPGIT